MKILFKFACLFAAGLCITYAVATAMEAVVKMQRQSFRSSLPVAPAAWQDTRR